MLIQRAAQRRKEIAEKKQREEQIRIAQQKAEHEKI
jgi:hypothetical protein